MAFFPANFFLRTSQEDAHQPPAINGVLPSCAPQDFHGVAVPFVGKRCRPFSGLDLVGEEGNNGDDDLSDDGSQIGEKKKRLNMEQVKTLEKNFELGNKLEPERKLQLARVLGLQPRQIAIWFQNRRARWKTKQLEKDYDLLKRQFEAIKADNEALQARNKKLQEEMMALKGRKPTESINLNKETEGSCSNRSENSSDIRLDISMTPPIDNPSFRPLFPSSSSKPPPVMAHLFGTSSRPDDPLQWQKIDQIIKEESLGNMFCGIEDQSGFWPLLEQQQFNGQV